MVLEYVEHGPLLSTHAHGVAVGVALAEIHSTRFASSGLFGSTIAMKQTWHDFPQKMEEYFRSQACDIPSHAALIQNVAKWTERRKSFLRKYCAAVHHIGSTSVPGLAAKPSIDILVVVHCLNELDACDDSMKNLGYVPKGEFGIPGRRFYAKGSDDHRTHHVHAFVPCRLA